MSTETGSILRAPRIRFNEPGADSIAPSESTTATDAAVAHLRKTAVSLPFSTLQQVVLEFGKEIILATAKVHRQKAITASFDDDTRIPKSARVSFTLNGSKTVAGTATFIAATEATTALIADFQKGIAAQVKIVAGLELLAVQLDRAKLIYRSICIWVNTAAILSPTDYDATHPILQFVRLAASIADIRPLIADVDKPTRNSIESEILGAAAAVEPPNDALPSSSQVEFTDWCTDAIAGTIKAFEIAQKEIRALESARAFISGTRTETATAAAAAVVDNEPPVSAATLQSLIDAAVAKALKKAGTVDSKNQRRGAKNQGASLKKKSRSAPAAATATTTPSQQQKQQQHRNNGRSKSPPPNLPNSNESTSPRRKRPNKRKRAPPANGTANNAADSNAALPQGNNDDSQSLRRKKSRAKKSQQK
jgi:hypothetical protein